MLQAFVSLLIVYTFFHSYCLFILIHSYSNISCKLIGLYCVLIFGHINLAPWELDVQLVGST